MQSKKRIFAIANIVLLIIVVIFVILWFNRDNQPAATEVSFTAEAGKSVLEQTKQQTDAVIIDRGQGAYVQSIGGLENSDKGTWTYYVDGQTTDTIPESYFTKGGELIQWKFE